MAVRSLCQPLPLRPARRPQGVFGDVASTAVGPDGSVWVLHRGGAVWDSNTFDESNRMRNTQKIAAPCVHRMDPDPGKVLASWGAGAL